MTDINKNKQIIQNFIQAVWNGQNLNALKDFWTEDCINHAMLGSNNCGLEAMRVYSGLQLDERQFGRSPLSKSPRSNVLANLSVPYVAENRCIMIRSLMIFSPLFPISKLKS